MMNSSNARLLTLHSWNGTMTSSVGFPFLILSNESSIALMDADKSVNAGIRKAQFVSA